MKVKAPGGSGGGSSVTVVFRAGRRSVPLRASPCMKRNDIATATHDTAATITAIVPPTVPAVDSMVAPPRTAAAGNAPFSNFLKLRRCSRGWI